DTDLSALSLHDALPILSAHSRPHPPPAGYAGKSVRKWPTFLPSPLLPARPAVAGVPAAGHFYRRSLHFLPSPPPVAGWHYRADPGRGKKPGIIPAPPPPLHQFHPVTIPVPAPTNPFPASRCG